MTASRRRERRAGRLVVVRNFFLAALVVGRAGRPVPAGVPGRRRARGSGHRHPPSADRLAGVGAGTGPVQRHGVHRQPDPGAHQPGGQRQLDRGCTHQAGRRPSSSRTTCRSCSAGATTTAPTPRTRGRRRSSASTAPSDAVYGGRLTAFGFGNYTLTRVMATEGWPSFEAAEQDGAYEPASGVVWRPFRAVDGQVVNSFVDPAFDPQVEGGQYWLNPYFNVITTNEIPGARTAVQRRGHGARRDPDRRRVHRPRLRSAGRHQRRRRWRRPSAGW